MCLINDCADKIFDTYNEIYDIYNDLTKQYNVVNNKILDVLHFLESENINACRGWYYAKTLKDLRIERRKIKNELEPLKKFIYGFVEKSKTYLTMTTENLTKLNDILEEKTKNKIYHPKELKQFI